MWHYQRECSPNAGNPRILLQHEAFGLRASPHTVYFTVTENPSIIF